ncbi:hypothetical protein BGZ83_001733, partial [Gryganskiella cystojenkinii]
MVTSCGSYFAIVNSKTDDGATIIIDTSAAIAKVQASEVAKAKRTREVTADRDIANKSNQQAPTPTLPVDERLVDIVTGDQVAVDEDLDNIEDLEIVEDYDEDEDEPLIRSRHYQAESTKNKDKASHKPIQQAQALVSPIDEGLMEFDKGAQIAEDEVAKTPGGRHKSKGKARVLSSSSASPLGPFSLSIFAYGGIEPVGMGNDKFQTSQSSSPAGQSTSRFKRQRTAAHGGLP